MFYSLRIKIVALKLPSSKNSPSLTLRCTQNSHLLAENKVQMQDGLLVQNTAISFQLNASSLPNSKPITLCFSEKEITSTAIGTTTITIQDFENVKMRKFAISTRNPSEDAYIEAFLLMLQSRSQETANQMLLPPTVRTCAFSKSMFSQSKINIEMENSSYYEPDSSKSIQMHSPTLKKMNSQEVETQTYNIESLLTINSILEESNATLEKERVQLQRRVKKLEETLERQQTRRHIDNQYKLRIEQMNDEVENLKENLKDMEEKLQKTQTKLQEKIVYIASYQHEMNKMSATIEQLKQQNQSYEQQISILLEKRQGLSVKELNIDEMMLELTKYSETAKRYKNINTQPTSGPIINNLISSTIGNHSSVRDFLSQKTQSKRSQVKANLNKKCISGEQTLDSMTQSKVF